jgi:hypothetical protein
MNPLFADARARTATVLSVAFWLGSAGPGEPSGRSGIVAGSDLWDGLGPPSAASAPPSPGVVPAGRRQVAESPGSGDDAHQPRSRALGRRFRSVRPRPGIVVPVGSGLRSTGLKH